MSTTIEWTDATWNVVTGCTKVSVAGRGMGPWKGRRFTDVQCLEERLSMPLRRRKPTRFFIDSMSDLGHPDVPFQFLDRIMAVVALCPQHTFYALTKRPERMLEYQVADGRCMAILKATLKLGMGLKQLEQTGHKYNPWPLDNLWLGVSVEDQATADQRIPLLLQTPAAHRFVSCEPLLGPVDLLDVDGEISQAMQRSNPDTLLWPADVIDWVICGGESGPGARPFNIDWARLLRDQCKAAFVPFFLKQLGSNVRGYNERCWRCGAGDWGAIDYGPGRHPGYWNCNRCGADSTRLRHPKGADPAEWPEDLRVREVPS